MFTATYNLQNRKSPYSLLNRIQANSGAYLKARKEHNIPQMAATGFHFLSDFLFAHRKKQIIASQLKDVYRHLHSYQNVRSFYDLTSQMLKEFEGMQEVEFKTMLLTDKLMHKKLRNVIRIVKTYNQRAECKIKSLDKPVYLPGSFFNKITEEEGWKERCKQYAVLA